MLEIENESSAVCCVIHVQEKKQPVFVLSKQCFSFSAKTVLQEKVGGRRLRFYSIFFIQLIIKIGTYL